MLSSALALVTWPNALGLFTGIFKGLWKAITGFFGSLNAQGWLGFIVAALLTFVFLHELGIARHWSKQSARWETLYNNEVAAKRKAEALKAKTDAQSSTIAEKNKEKNDAQDASDNTVADDIRVHGPGKAVCPTASTASGEPVAPSRTGPANVVQLPDSGGADLIALPFDDAVTIIQQCALNRNEVLTWRNNDAQQREAWPKP